MAPVAGRPFLAYLIEQVRSAGCTTVVLCIGYKGHIIEAYFGDGRAYGVTLLYSREQQLLGTAGALALARPLLRQHPCFVLNGDSYCPLSFPALWAHHQAHEAKATLVAATVPDPAPYGRLVLAADDAVLQFREKGEPAGPSPVNAGIYLLEQTVLDLIPTDRPFSLEHDLFPKLAGRGLYAFRQAAPFIDMGTPTAWRAAQTVLPPLWPQA